MSQEWQKPDFELIKMDCEINSYAGEPNGRDPPPFIKSESESLPGASA